MSSADTQPGRRQDTDNTSMIVMLSLEGRSESDRNTGCVVHTCLSQETNVPIQLSRFLQEPSHKHGVAFVRPDSKELSRLEKYVDILKTEFGAAKEEAEQLDLESKSEEEADLEGRTDKIDGMGK